MAGVRETNIKIPFISKLAYGMGDVGNNFNWMFVGNFLMIFYTDVFGISMATIATLMLVARVWEAVSDPVIGVLSDHTKTRWGRYRPWLLFGAPLTAVTLIVTFWAHPGWSTGGKTIYVYLTYCLVVLGYTCVNIPYGTLCGTMTQNIDERAKINTSRSVCAMIAINIINMATLPLITVFGGANKQQGYLWVAVVYAVIFMGCHFFCFSKTREVVTPPPKQKLSLVTQLKAASQNRPYLLALAGNFLFGMTLYGRNADLVYYFTYVEKNAGLFSVYSMLMIVPSIVGAAAFPFVFRWIGNKGRTASMFALGTGVTLLALYFFDATGSPVLFYSVAAISQVFFCGFNTAIYAIIPDCVEYGEWKTGLRNDGFQYAFVTLGNNLGMAVGTALLAAVLGSVGYIANHAQNQVVVSVIHHSFSTVPGILWLVIALVLFFYRINKRSYNKILGELKNRKLRAAQKSLS